MKNIYIIIYKLVKYVRKFYSNRQLLVYYFALKNFFKKTLKKHLTFIKKSSKIQNVTQQFVLIKYIEK